MNLERESPIVSVVIPVRNGGATIGQQLEALATQDFDGDWELIVANNGSTDNTLAVVEAYRSRFKRLRITYTDGGVGINLARNAGVRAAQGDLVLICDADDVVKPGWITAHVSALRKVDISGGPLDHVSLNREQVAQFNNPGKQESCPVCARFLPYATGCNFAFKRSVWEDINGFDNDWQRGCTETEFCWRAQLAGFSIGWTPDAVVAYRKGANLASEIRRRYRSAKANARLFSAFKDAGMPRTSLHAALKAWAWVLYRIPWALGDSTWRKKWLQVLSWRAGLLAGSLRYRVLYL